ncbi:hypothetical protein AYK26_02595 [Euryarchaeota archaeon SM23-78]|nr:MAG: hypothetical protein AYK26_02595 [Euryarchaeota archaeon SM23-78]
MESESFFLRAKISILICGARVVVAICCEGIHQLYTQSRRGGWPLRGAGAFGKISGPEPGNPLAKQEL